MARWEFSRGFWSDHFEHLLANELTIINDRFLRHEYEFSSGASIIVEFEKLVYRRKRIRRKYAMV